MPVNEAARRVVESVLLAAIVRVMLLVGTPVMIGLLTWFAGGFIAMQTLSSVQAAEQARLVSEVRELQDYRRDAYARGQAMQTQVASIQNILASQARTLERIDDRLNRANMQR